MTYAISRAPVLRKTVRMQTVWKEDMMKNFEYTVMKMFWKAGSVLHISGKKSISKWFRRNGMKIGDNCTICCNILPSEPYLVTIGNNVTISAPVQLLTHDNSIIKMSHGESTDIFGEINIGDNCFIGAGTVILPGVTLADNIVVAAGSVVTKSFFESNIIIGGNPAKKITTWELSLEKNIKYAQNIRGLSQREKRKLLMNADKIMRDR